MSETQEPMRAGALRHQLKMILQDVQPYQWIAFGWITASLFVCLLSIVMTPFRTVMDVAYLVGASGALMLLVPPAIRRILAFRIRRGAGE